MVCRGDANVGKKISLKVVNVPGKSPDGAMNPALPQGPKASRELLKTPQATVMTKEQRVIF